MRIHIGNDLTNLGFYIDIVQDAYFGDDVNAPPMYALDEKMRRFVRESIDKLIATGYLKIDEHGNPTVHGENGRPILMKEYLQAKRALLREGRLQQLKNEEDRQTVYDSLLEEDEEDEEE